VRFKKKGWPHVGAMEMLIPNPNTTKSKHLFHPTGLGERRDPEEGGDDNVGDLVGVIPGDNGEPEGGGKGQEVNIDWPTSDADDQLDLALKNAHPLPPPPVSKRKYSALMASASITPSPGLSAKRRHVSAAAISPDSEMTALNVWLDNFTDAFWSATGTSVAAGLESSPMCRHRAIHSAHELEINLSDVRLAALINIFIADVNAADAYMELKREGLRKTWVADRLRHLDM